MSMNSLSPRLATLEIEGLEMEGNYLGKRQDAEVSFSALTRDVSMLTDSARPNIDHLAFYAARPKALHIATIVFPSSRALAIPCQ
jgi:hypothetical protein